MRSSARETSTVSRLAEASSASRQAPIKRAARMRFSAWASQPRGTLKSPSVAETSRHCSRATATAGRSTISRRLLACARTSSPAACPISRRKASYGRLSAAAAAAATSPPSRSGSDGSAATAGQSQRWTKAARSSMSLPPLLAMADLPGRGAFDEFARKAFDSRLEVRGVEQHFDQLHCHVDHLTDRLAHGGERMRRPAGHGDVVEADDRQIARDVQSKLPPRRIHEADGENIFGAELAARPARPAKQARGGLVSPLIGEGASLDADRFLESVVEASAPIAFPPVDSGGGVGPARDEREAPMAKLDQMIGDKPPA